MNPAQGFDLRTLLGGGISKFFIENTARLFALNFGAVYNREEVTDSAEVNNVAELLTSLSYRRYKHDAYSPAIDITLTAFADIASEERYRAAFRFNMAWKIINNYTFNFRIDDNYDSNPPGEGANKNNVIVVTSVGYTF